MPNPVMIVRHLTDQADRPLGRNCYTWCPGCDGLHPFRIVNEDGTPPADGHHTWDWDGNLEAPSFNPSLLVYSSVHLCDPKPHYEVCTLGDACEAIGHYVSPDGPAHVIGCPDGAPGWGNCHSFLRAGVWDFLGDSTAHQLRGHHPMVPLPDTYIN